MHRYFDRNQDKWSEDECVEYSNRPHLKGRNTMSTNLVIIKKNDIVNIFFNLNVSQM